MSEVIQPSGQPSEGREPHCCLCVPQETTGAQRGFVLAQSRTASTRALGGPVHCQGPGDHCPVRPLQLTLENLPLLAAPDTPGDGVAGQGVTPPLYRWATGQSE